MTVTVSPKFQVVIPEDVRKRLGVKPGQKYEVFDYKGRIEFILVGPMRNLKGMAKGIDTTIDRDEGDRL